MRNSRRKLLRATEDFERDVCSFADFMYTTKQAETAIIFQICALAEVGNIKNNLIAVSRNREREKENEEDDVKYLENICNAETESFFF